MSIGNLNTEASFEARINPVLKEIFPGFADGEIIHQLTFTLRFGHHNVLIKNETKENAKGRLDILLTIKDKPIAIFELKNTSIPINTSDVEQGISYARLTEPITPLTIISNGTDTEIYNTYTREKLEQSNIDDKNIEKVIKAGMTLAANSKAEAISLLLGEDVEILSQIIKQISELNFSPYIGELTEYTKPICKDFSIPRTLCNQILNLTSKNHLIALVGEAFSGKTNILWQINNLANWPVICVYYVDASSSYGVLQQLANHLSKLLSIPITKHLLRNWAINGFIAQEDYSLLIILDNWNENVHPDLQTEFLELLDLFRGTGNSILLSMDSATYKKLTIQKDRLTKNVIGHESVLIKLGRLTPDEFEGVNNLLYSCNQHFLGMGAQFHPWFLQPRSLRILAGFAKEDLVHLKDETIAPREGMSKAFEIPSVPDDLIFNIIKKTPISKEFKGYLKIHAKCFLEERKNNLAPGLRIILFTTGAVTLKSLKASIDEKILDNYIIQGLLQKEYFDESETIIYPALVEQIAAELPEIIKDKVLYKEGNEDTHAAYQELKSLCTLVPYGDIVGFKVMILIGQVNPILYGDLFNELINDEPTFEEIKAGTTIMTQFKDSGRILIKFEGDQEEKFIDNILPWSIASHLLMKPMKADGEPSDYHAYLSALQHIGNFNGGLFFVNQELLSEPFFLIYQPIPKYGEVLSSEMGIVEPIVHAMRNAIREIPDEMKSFVDSICSEDKFHLIFRLNLASRFIYETGIKNIDEAVDHIYIHTYKRLQELLDQAFFEKFNIDMKALRDENENKTILSGDDNEQLSVPI